ncbi:T9SS type A sorting domain-containing protein [bacterium]|nr:T9SS type A sorting domain-containing protein [bacterium]
MKTGLVILALLMAATVAFGANFAPTVMKISASDMIPYNFDGKTLEIPVTVTGTPAAALFTVFTKDKANQIVAVKNGYLGWHFVNKIDTCVYMGSLQQLDIGKSVLKWEGKDNDGKLVPAGEYTYYIYGYDNVNQKKAVNRYCFMDRYNQVKVVTHKEDGTPKSNPQLYFSDLTKMTIGTDPNDSTLVEKTTTDLWGHHLVLDPNDYNYFYFWCPDQESVVERIAKLQWVPNGPVVLQTDWGNEGFSKFTVANMLKIANWNMADIEQVQDYIIMATHDNTSFEPTNIIAYISMEDGVFDHEVDMSDRWYSKEDAEKGGQASGGPTQIVKKHDYLMLSRFNACYREMINPLAEDDADFIMWGNGNGDYVGDHNFAADSPRPWVCNDYNVAPYAYVTGADENLFSSFGCYDMGAVSFGLIAPDGTGIGYFAFAGETANIKIGTVYVDYGSPFDGIYTDNTSTGGEGETTGIWYVAHDSIKGTITSNPVAVEETAPSSFAVAQNSPNPFNPSTTLNFTLPEAGVVSVDVYNSAGQKVTTIADGYLGAGNHSAVWDASGFSAGVYFCTVKSGAYAKTIKMTLLK